MGFIIWTLIFLLDVTLGDKRYIIVHPDKQIVTFNSTITLQCRVVPMKNIKVQWVKNGFGLGDTRADIRQYGQLGNVFRYDLPNDLDKGQYDLQITNVNLQDEGDYYCQTSINNNAITSTRATVQVLVASEPPKIFQLTNEGKGPEKQRFDNAPIVVDNGQLMVLRCQSERGRPGALLTWMIDNEPIDIDSRGNFNGRLTGTITREFRKYEKEPKLRDTFSTLKAKVNQFLNGKSIQCSAINKGYEKFNLPIAAARIEIHVAPTVTMEILNHRLNNEFEENEWITIICTATGRPDKFTWKWYINDNEVNNENRSSYKLQATRTMNKAVVKCVASNRKEGYSQQTINVKYGPQFLDHSSSVYPANIGDDVKLVCDTDSNPISSVYWQRESSNDILGHGSVLYRKNVQELDFGIYICTASAENFTPIFKKLYLAKRSKPFISENPDRSANLGKSVQIRCVINSIPEVQHNQIMWFHLGRRIIGDNYRYVIFTEKFLGGSTSVLSINNITNYDFGQYNCSASTELGSDWKIMKLSKMSQMPFILIVGGTVLVTMVMLIIIVVICVCKKGFCHSKYQKGSPTNRLNTNSQDPLKSPQFEMDYQCQPNFFQWIPTNSRDPVKSSFVRYGQDIDERSSIRNGSINQFRGLDMCSTYTSSIPGSHNGEKQIRNGDMDDMYKDEYYPPPNPPMMCSMHVTPTGVGTINRTSPCNIHQFPPSQHTISLPQYNLPSFANSSYLSNYITGPNPNFGLPSYPVHSPSSEPGINGSANSILPPVMASIDANDATHGGEIGSSAQPVSFIKPGMTVSQQMATYLAPNARPKPTSYNYAISPNASANNYKSRTLDRRGPNQTFATSEQTTNI